jgi:RimJ/RimL family protein N-acetyltransferase
VGARQGQGLAAEAMRAAIGWADVHGKGEKLTAIIDPGNSASQRVAQKLGFVRVAEGVYMGKPIILFERPRGAA